jgi:K+-transporting ATPase A subunit
MTRTVLYVLLPIAIVVGLFFVWQGMPQNLGAYAEATTLEGAKQVIAQGPVASQEVIKMLGTNGGGFFNANSAHPYENPNARAGLAMWIGRFLLIVPMLAVAGSLAGKKLVPALGWNLPDGWWAFHRSSDRRDLDHGRPYLLPRLSAWTYRGASRDARRQPILTAAEHFPAGRTPAFVRKRGEN